MTNPLSLYTAIPTWGVLSAAISTAHAETPVVEPTQTTDLTASTTTVDADVPHGVMADANGGLNCSAVTALLLGGTAAALFARHAILRRADENWKKGQAQPMHINTRALAEHFRKPRPGQDELSYGALDLILSGVEHHYLPNITQLYPIFGDVDLLRIYNLYKTGGSQRYDYSKAMDRFRHPLMRALHDMQAIYSDSSFLIEDLGKLYDDAPVDTALAFLKRFLSFDQAKLAGFNPDTVTHLKRALSAAVDPESKTRWTRHDAREKAIALLLQLEPSKDPANLRFLTQLLKSPDVAERIRAAHVLTYRSATHYPMVETLIRESANGVQNWQDKLAIGRIKFGRPTFPFSYEVITYYQNVLEDALRSAFSLSDPSWYSSEYPDGKGGIAKGPNYLNLMVRQDWKHADKVLRELLIKHGVFRADPTADPRAAKHLLDTLSGYYPYELFEQLVKDIFIDTLNRKTTLAWKQQAASAMLHARNVHDEWFMLLLTQVQAATLSNQGEYNNPAQLKLAITSARVLRDYWIQHDTKGRNKYFVELVMENIRTEMVRAELVHAMSHPPAPAELYQALGELHQTLGAALAAWKLKFPSIKLIAEDI